MPAYVEVNVPVEEWEHAVLTIQGHAQQVMMRRLGGKPRIVAEWPRSGTGHYLLCIEAPFKAQRQITILPAKISTDAYQTMLLDLESRLPAAIAIALQHLGGLGGLTIHPPSDSTIAEEFNRLKRAVHGTSNRPGLVRILQRLAHNPHHVLRNQEVWLPVERSRHPIPSRLTRAMTMPNNMTAEQALVRIADQRSVFTYDIFENQLLLLYWKLVTQRLKRLEHLLEVRMVSPLSEDIRSWQKDLAAARNQATFLDDVTLLHHLPTQLTMVIRKRPEYHAALVGYLELHRSLAVRFDHPALESPLENLPLLYQLWGTMEVMTKLLETAGTFGYQVESQQTVRRIGSDMFVEIVPNGQPIVTLRHPEHGTSIRLIPEQRFRHSGPLRSISYTQIPDVVVEFRDRDNRSRLYLFDPKYKLDGELIDEEPVDGKPKKVDIDKMHAYRDAIRDAAGVRVVENASILYPGPTVMYTTGIGAIQAVPGKADVLAEQLKTIFEHAFGRILSISTLPHEPTLHL